MKHVVLVGLGHAHLEVLRLWTQSPPPQVSITLVSPCDWVLYSGMVPGVFSRRYQWDQARISAGLILRNPIVRYIAQNVERLDTNTKCLYLSGGLQLRYDLVSLNVGSTSEALPKAASSKTRSTAQTLGIRPLGDFYENIEHWFSSIPRNEGAPEYPVLYVVGSGLTGVELALNFASRRVRDQLQFQIVLVEASHYIAPRVNRYQRQALHKVLRQAGVLIKTDAKFDFDRLHASDVVVFATGAKGHAWIQNSDLQSEDGFVIVNDSLQSVSHPEVFGAGDCVKVKGRDYEKSGVFPVRQGPHLDQNLRLYLHGLKPQPHTYKKNPLYIVSHGNGTATALIYGVAISGRWIQRWKEKIDQNFVAKYNGGYRKSSSRIKI